MTSLAVLSSGPEVRREVIAEAPKEIKGLDIHRAPCRRLIEPNELSLRQPPLIRQLISLVARLERSFHNRTFVGARLRFIP